MIREDKLIPACVSLNRVLVWARWLASEAGNTELRDYLDAAEYLPSLMARDEDLTDHFRGTLADLAERHPHLKSALQDFDKATVPSASSNRQAS